MTAKKSQLVRVGLADKNPLIQAALKQLLSEDGRFCLVHVASGCEDFLRNIAREPIDVGVIGWIIGPCDGRFVLDTATGARTTSVDDMVSDGIAFIPERFGWDARCAVGQSG